MTTPEIQEVGGGMTEDQAAQSLIDKWVPKEDDDPEESTEAEVTDEPEAEQADEATADADEDAEAQAEESGEAEIDVGGEKFKVPAALAEQAKRIEAKVKEIEAGTTRKFQEAAEMRKSAESRIQAAENLQKIAHEQGDLIADHRMVERRLAALELIDVNALKESDPVQLAAIGVEYNQLQAAKQRIEGHYRQTVQQSQELSTRQHQEKVQALNEFAKKSIKGWSDDYSNRLMEFSVKELGFSPDALRTSINEPLMRAIDLAYQGHKVRTADPKAKQILNTKTLKPGSAGQVKTNAHATYEQARKKLAKTGSTEDAAMALLARARLRKR
jgi:phage terminase small subunit